MNEIDTIKAVASNYAGFEVAPDKVLVELEQDKDYYEGKIKLIKADEFKRYSRTGWVRQIGLNLINKVDFRLDDRVVFECYAGSDLELDKKDYKVIADKYIQAKIGD